MSEDIKLRRDTVVLTVYSETHLKQEGETMNKPLFPMKLQFFAEGGSEGNNNQQNNSSSQQGNSGQQNQGFQFDYDKLANIVAGKQNITEDKVLGGYFKQQGLTGDEVQQAINAFKEQKAKNTPDTVTLQSNLDTANKALNEALVNNQAILEAIALGLDVKAVTYVLKMADFTNAVGSDGKVNAEEVKKALEKVLEDVPALKGNSQQNNNGSNEQHLGGFQVGSSGNQNNQNSQEDILRNIFGIKKS